MCGYDWPEVVGATVELVVAAEALVGERLSTLTALETVSVPQKTADIQKNSVLDATTTTGTRHRSLTTHVDVPVTDTDRYGNLLTIVAQRC